MPERNLLLEAMKAGEHVLFDPHGSQTEPFTAEVEMLLGGIPVVVFSDGSEQFLDDSAEPCLAYSPRLMSGELEAFAGRTFPGTRRSMQSMATPGSRPNASLLNRSGRRSANEWNIKHRVCTGPQ